jgi:hypothetical protein
MFNSYSSVQAFWSDTTLMDNLRGGDATGLATPGAQEVSIDPESGHTDGFGNTSHTYSEDTYASYNTDAGKVDANFTYRLTK